MQHTDAQLIQRTLQGDQDAFSPLVKKYQKGVHALAWRKIGDFHIAQDITQDAFLRAYQKLGTLKNPNAFAGWLYVIVAHLCLDWLRKNRIPMESLDTTDSSEVDKVSYSQYVTDQQKSEADDTRREIVKELLKKLPESERTVMTLHYLGEMTIKAISEFLGVSPNTVKSRLSRARNRLRKQEDVIRENLGSFQLPNQLTENIMREVSRLTPAAPATSKPMVPWAALGAATVLVILMLGVSSQYLARFQKPYSFDALSEPTVEIVDAPIAIDIVSKPDIRRRFGRSDLPSKSTGTGTQISESDLRSTAQADRHQFSTAQWRQGYGPPGGHFRDIFTTSEGTLYTVSQTGMYRLMAGAPAWTRINASVPMSASLMPMVENRGVLYIVSVDKIFASMDNGETWNAFCSRPKGKPVGLVVIDEAREPRTQANITLYLALRDEGIFRSTDGGTQWRHLNEGLVVSEKISAVTAVGKTVFAGTEIGLYRLDSGVWQKLPVDTSGAVCSLAVSGNNLYVGTGSDLLVKLSLPMEVGKFAGQNREHSIKILHSADLGATWTDITPEHKYSFTGPPAGITVLTIGDTLLALGYVQSRSTDGGKTWSKIGYDPYMPEMSSIPIAAVDEKTLYKAGAFGIHRTTDGGESWHLFMDGVLGTRIIDLISFDDRLYANNSYEAFQSTDASVSWQSVPMAADSVPSESVKQKASRVNFLHTNYGSKFVVSDNALYFVSPIRDALQIFRLSTDSNMLIPVQGIPTFEVEETTRLDSESYDSYPETATVAISRNVFYVEYKRRLFKWRLGDSEWINTGLIDTGEVIDEDSHSGFKIAASRETVYVGKRDGRLFQSFDEGGNWRDVTPNLPLRFTRFKAIVFSGSTVYVATDAGVLVSETGEHWRVITDKADTRVVITQFVVDGTEVYGVGDTGAYRLETRGHWEQVSSEVAGEILALALMNGRLYSAVEERGIFHIPLEEAADNGLTHK